MFGIVFTGRMTATGARKTTPRIWPWIWEVMDIQRNIDAVRRVAPAFN